MTWLLENPWPIVVGALLVESLLAAALYATGKLKLGIVMALVLLVALVLVAVERWAVTETEEIENTLAALEAALETNDLPTVMAFLAPDAAGIRGAAQSMLPRVTITDANVGGDLKITLGAGTPRTATAEFTGRVSVQEDSSEGLLPYDNLVREFTLQLRKDGDRWLLTDYELGDLPGGVNPR